MGRQVRPLERKTSGIELTDIAPYVPESTTTLPGTVVDAVHVIVTIPGRELRSIVIVQGVPANISTVSIYCQRVLCRLITNCERVVFCPVPQSCGLTL